MTEIPDERRSVPCWQGIGIAGNQSCAKLGEFVHCRNCPTYVERGLALLERPAPADYASRWTEILAAEKSAELPARRPATALVFRINRQWLALPADCVTAVTRRLPVCPVPHRAGGQLQGLVNVQGVLRLCVSIHDFFDGAAAPPGAAAEAAAGPCMLMVENGGENWVFGVDEVAGLHDYRPEAVQNTPVTATKTADRLSAGAIPWQKGMLGILDAAKFFAALRRILA
jgi:chemotaxis-related protein WspD